VWSWDIHPVESAELAAELVHKAILSQGCILNPPVLHADNGGPRKGYTMQAKLDALGVGKSYSRPRVSNDNPYSEALFRTCKYRPDYPSAPFASIEDSRQWVASFVHWYNYQHYTRLHGVRLLCKGLVLFKVHPGAISRQGLP
jgi:transposase InsO family protein